MVAVCFESGVRATLKPLIDAVLAKGGLPPVDLAQAPTYGGPLPLDPFPAPAPVVTYDEAEGYLQVENGQPLVGEQVVAKGLSVFFDRDNPDEGAGLRIGPKAGTILKPFLDAVVTERGGSGKSANEPAKPAS